MRASLSIAVSRNPLRTRICVVRCAETHMEVKNMEEEEGEEEEEEEDEGEWEDEE